MGHEVLQLRSPPHADAGTQQRIAQRRVRPEQRAAHQHLPYDRVDKRRMHAVAAEVAHADQTSAPPRQGDASRATAFRP